MNWTLYGDESFSIQPASTERRTSSSCSSAAARSIPNVHSYGYETNGTTSCSRTPATGPCSPVSPSSSPSASRVPISLPSSTSWAKSGVAENARQSSRPRSDRTRKIRPSERTTRLSGSRNDPGSRSVAVPVCSST